MRNEHRHLHVDASHEMSFGQFLGSLLDSITYGPPRNCGGADANGNLPEEDADLLARTKHVRRKGERLIQLIARTGISPLQIRAWEKQAIADFCARAEAAESERDPAPPMLHTSKQGPTTPRIVLMK